MSLVIETLATLPLTEATEMDTPLDVTDWAGGLPARSRRRIRVGRPFFTSWIKTMSPGMPRDQPSLRWNSYV